MHHYSHLTDARAKTAGQLKDKMNWNSINANLPAQTVNAHFRSRKHFCQNETISLNVYWRARPELIYAPSILLFSERVSRREWCVHVYALCWNSRVGAHLGAEKFNDNMNFQSWPTWQAALLAKPNHSEHDTWQENWKRATVVGVARRMEKKMKHFRAFEMGDLMWCLVDLCLIESVLSSEHGPCVWANVRNIEWPRDIERVDGDR